MHLVNGTGNSPSPGQPTPGVVKQDKSSRGSVDKTKTRSDPQRVRMSSGEKPIGKQSDTEALCHPPPPPQTPLPPPLPLPMFEADSQNFASAPSAPGGFKLEKFWPAFGGDHSRTLGGGGSQPNPPSNTSLPLDSVCWWCMMIGTGPVHVWGGWWGLCRLKATWLCLGVCPNRPPG